MMRDKNISLRQNMVWNSAGSMTRLACNYFITIAVVRLSSGFDAAGSLALAMSISNVIWPLADFRLRTVQITDVHNEHSSGEYVGLRILTSLFAVSVGLIYALVTVAWESIFVIFLYCIYTIAVNFIEAFHAIDWRHKRMDISGTSYMLQGVSNLTAFCLVLWGTNSLILAIVSLIVTTVLVGALYDMPRSAHFEPITPSIELRSAVKTLLVLSPLVFAQVCSAAVLTIPKQHLELILGSSALGIYSSVASPVVIVQMGATYVYSPLMGEFAERFANVKSSGLELLRKTAGIVIAATSFVSVTLLIVGDPILKLMFGQQIGEHTYLLQPAILCTLVTAAVWFMNDLLLAIRDYRGAFVGNAVAALVAVTISYQCVMRFGMNGVSWVGVIAYGVGLLVMAVFFVLDYRKMTDPPVTLPEDLKE